MKLSLFFLMLTLSSTSWSQTSYVAPTTILSKSAYQLGISGEVFTTTKRIDKDGKDSKFENGETFQRLQSEVAGYFGLTENFQVGAGARFRQNQSTQFDVATGDKETKNSTGIESTFVSFIYAFKPVDRLSYSLEGAFRYRPYNNEKSAGADPGSLVLGDEGNDFFGGLGVTYSSRTKNYLSGRFGYRLPGEDLSDELYWQVEGALVWKYLALVAGVDGTTSLKNDPFEDDPLNKPSYNTGNTALYNSTNREWIAPYAGVNLALGTNWRVELRGSQVVSGRSTDLGTAFGVSLIRRVDDQKKGLVDKKFKEYDFEATITKISPKKGYVVIDKGLADDIQKGMKIDFFEFDYVGGNILLARGIVIQSKADTAIIKITQLYNTKKQLKEGIVARGSFK